jgi:hypothetical protein
MFCNVRVCVCFPNMFTCIYCVLYCIVDVYLLLILLLPLSETSIPVNDDDDDDNIIIITTTRCVTNQKNAVLKYPSICTM